MSKIATGPCGSCPYRKDVPAGLWHPEEYDKLAAFDRPTMEQPAARFMCHAVPDNLCFGWASCYSNRGHANELLALRLHRFPLDTIPPSPVPLFASGAAACKYGKKKKMSTKALKAAEKLLQKYPRLRKANPF